MLSASGAVSDQSRIGISISRPEHWNLLDKTNKENKDNSRKLAAIFLFSLKDIETLKVVCNEMEGGWDTCLFSPYWYGTHVIVVGLNFNGDVVF